jgi:hypothetical protein
MNKAFNLAFKTGNSGFLLLLAMGLLLGGMEHMLGPKQLEPFLTVVQVCALLGAIAWLFGTLLLWMEGWLFVAQGWRARHWYQTFALLIFQVFFNVLAAYCFHVYRQRQHKG